MEFELISPENGITFSIVPNSELAESSDIESGISHYEVWINGSNVENVLGTGNTTYTTDSLDLDNYSWYVFAVDYFGNSRKSDNTFSFSIEGELSIGNVNEDNEVGIIDALQIARHDADEPNSFP